MTGTIVITKGKATDSGTVTLTAIGDSQSQVTITTPAGTRTEVRAISAQGLASEKWTGPDGTVHHFPAESLVTPHPAWFFPAFVMAAEPASNFASSSAGTETKNGASVEHVQSWKQSAGSAASDFLQRETIHDFYLDPATSLPVSTAFAVKPDTSQQPHSVSLRNITHVPEEVRFSDYRLVQGVPVPYHIALYISGNILFDIQVDSVQVNTGVTIPSTE
jgi:hypothetical protein